MSGELTREERFAQYGRALDEYRFQVEVNWRRTQYFLALNTAVAASGLGLLSSSAQVARELLVALFVIGTALAGFAAYATVVQHAYYRTARDLVGHIAAELPLGKSAIATTPGMGATRRRRISVHKLQIGMFILIAGVDVGGIYVSACG